MKQKLSFEGFCCVSDALLQRTGSKNRSNAIRKIDDEITDLVERFSDLLDFGPNFDSHIGQETIDSQSRHFYKTHAGFDRFGLFRGRF